MAELTRAQYDIAAAFFALRESTGFVIVGGAALLSLELIDRPTEDLDFFTDDATRVNAAAAALAKTAHDRRWEHRNIRTSDTFHRMELTCDGDIVRVDIAVDSPPRRPPTTSPLGPTLTPLELAGRKLLALFDRAAPRDYTDVHRLANVFERTAIIDIAREIDPGFDLTYLAVALDHAQRLRDEDFPIPADDVPALRAWCAAWAAEIRTPT